MENWNSSLDYDLADTRTAHLKHEVFAPLSEREMALLNGGFTQFQIKNLATEIWTSSDRAQYAQLPAEQQAIMSERMAEAKTLRNAIHMREAMDKMLQGKGGLETSRYASPAGKAAAQKNGGPKEQVNVSNHGRSNFLSVKTEKQEQSSKKLASAKGYNSRLSKNSTLSPLAATFHPSVSIKAEWSSDSDSKKRGLADSIYASKSQGDIKVTPSTDHAKPVATWSQKLGSSSSGCGRNKPYKPPTPKIRSPRPSVSPFEATKWAINDTISLADRQWSQDQQRLQKAFFKKSYGAPKHPSHAPRAEIPKTTQNLELTNSPGRQNIETPKSATLKVEGANEGRVKTEAEAAPLPVPAKASSVLDSLSSKLSNIKKAVVVMDNGEVYDLPTDTRTLAWKHPLSHDFGLHKYLPANGRILYPEAYNDLFEDVPDHLKGVNFSNSTIEKLKKAIESLKTPSTSPTSNDDTVAPKIAEGNGTHHQTLSAAQVDQVTTIYPMQVDKESKDRGDPSLAPLYLRTPENSAVQVAEPTVPTEGYELVYDRRQTPPFWPHHRRTLQNTDASSLAKNSPIREKGSLASTFSRNVHKEPKKKKVFKVKLTWSSGGGISDVQDVDDVEDGKKSQSSGPMVRERSQIVEGDKVDSKDVIPTEEVSNPHLTLSSKVGAGDIQKTNGHEDGRQPSSSEFLAPKDPQDVQNSKTEPKYTLPTDTEAHLKTPTSEQSLADTRDDLEVSDGATKNDFLQNLANHDAEKAVAKSKSSSLEVMAGEEPTTFTAVVQQIDEHDPHKATSNNRGETASQPPPHLNLSQKIIDESIELKASVKKHQQVLEVCSATVTQITPQKPLMETGKSAAEGQSSEWETDANNTSEIFADYGIEIPGEVQESQSLPRVKISSTFSTDGGIEISDEIREPQEQALVNQASDEPTTTADPNKKTNNNEGAESADTGKFNSTSPNLLPGKVFTPVRLAPKPGYDNSGDYSKIRPLLDYVPDYVRNAPFPTFAGDKVQEKEEVKARQGEKPKPVAGTKAQQGREMKPEQEVKVPEHNETESEQQVLQENDEQKPKQQEAQENNKKKHAQPVKQRPQAIDVLPEGSVPEPIPTKEDYLPPHLRDVPFPKFAGDKVQEKKPRPKVEQQLTHAPIPLPPGVNTKAKNKSGPVPAKDGIKFNKAGKKISGINKGLHRDEDGLWELPDNPNQIWRQPIDPQPDIRMVKMEKPEKLEQQLTKYDKLPHPNELNLDPSGWGSVISVHSSEAALPENKKRGYGRLKPKMALWEWGDIKEIQDPAGGEAKKVWKFADFNWDRDVADGEVDMNSRGCTLFLATDFMVARFNDWLLELVKLMFSHPFKIDIYHPAFISGEAPTADFHHDHIVINFPKDSLHGPQDPPNFGVIDWDPSDSEGESERLANPYSQLPTPSVQNDRSKQTSTTLIDARMARAYTLLQHRAAMREAIRKAEEYEYTPHHMVVRTDPFGPAACHDNPFSPRVGMYVRPVQEWDADQCAQIEAYWARYTLSSTRDGPVLPTHYRDIMRMVEERKLPFVVACAFNDRVPNRRKKMLAGRRDAHRERVIGFAYAKPFRSPLESAFRQTVEIVLFVDKQILRHGVGKTLLDRILPALDPGYHSHVGTEFKCSIPERLDFSRGGRTAIRKIVMSVFYERHPEKNCKGVPFVTAEGEQDEGIKSLMWKKSMLEGGFGFVQQADFFNIGAKWTDGRGDSLPAGSGKAVCMAQFVRETRDEWEIAGVDAQSKWYQGQPVERKEVVSTLDV